MILPLKDIETIDKENGFRFGYSGLVVVVRGHEELFFEFSLPDARDDLAVTLIQCLETAKEAPESRALSQEERLEVEAAKAEYELLEHARRNDIKDCEDVFKSIAIDSGEPDYCAVEHQRQDLTIDRERGTANSVRRCTSFCDRFQAREATKHNMPNYRLPGRHSALHSPLQRPHEGGAQAKNRHSRRV